MDESYDFQGLLLHISFIYAVKRALQIFGSASLGCKDLPLERMGRLHEKQGSRPARVLGTWDTPIPLRGCVCL